MTSAPKLNEKITDAYRASTSVTRENSGFVLRLVAVLAGLVLWELYASVQPEYFFPSLSYIFELFVEQVTEHDLVGRFAGSLVTLFTGYFLAVGVGIAVGLLMGIDERVEVLLDPYISALYVTPLAALVPIILIVGGTSFESKVFVVFLYSVLEVIINTSKGVQTTPSGLIDATRSFGGGKRFVLFNVTIPHVLPYIFAGMRLGIGVAIKGLVIAELLVEFSNLGELIRMYEVNYQIAGVLSIVVVLMVLGFVLTRSVQYLGRRVIVWQEDADV